MAKLNYLGNKPNRIILKDDVVYEGPYEVTSNVATLETEGKKLTGNITVNVPETPLPPTYDGSYSVGLGGTLSTSGKLMAGDVSCSVELSTLRITEAGSYTVAPSSDQGDGYSSVTVDIPAQELPQLNAPSVLSGDSSKPPVVINSYQNGNFAKGAIVSCDDKFAQFSNVSLGSSSSEKFLVWETFEVLPIAGGTSETLNYSLTGNNFNPSPARTSTWTYPSATETTGYMSVTGLGNSDPTSQTYTYDSDFPRSFPTVTDVYGNEFIRIPTIYRSVTVTDGQITGYKLALTQIDNTYEPYPCFVDETNSNAILPYILIGKWLISSTVTANSVNASAVVSNIGNFRYICRNRGTGYQQYDWKIRQLFIDLGIVLSRFVNINQGWYIYEAFGIFGQNQYIWVDGIIKGSNEDSNAWYLADKESDYYSPNSTSATEATILGNNYHKLSYSSPSAGGSITKLGYDSSHPFENYPNQVGGSISTYYCDNFSIESGSRPVVYDVGYNSEGHGWFCCYCSMTWYDTRPSRLCYRPILGATGYTE